MESDHGLLFSALIFLSAAVVSVPLAQRFGMGSVLGYLLAGVVIGPWGLGLIQDPDQIIRFAEFGVVLLLFLIGLELNPPRLWAMRRSILGLGGIQLAATALLLTGIGLGLGVAWRVAVVAGMGLALSSTAIALQLLIERRKLATDAGQSAFSILLFQDIAVIPMLAILPVLGAAGGEHEAGDGHGWLSTLEVAGVILAIVVGGRYLTRPVFRTIAATNLREIFVAFSLLLVIGVALLMHHVEMSMALGSFIAGVLLAESEYRHELEIDIEPFKGLLMGLFFIAVGMSVDFGLLLDRPFSVLGLVFALLGVKLVVLAGVSVVGRVALSQRPFFAILLSQGGEFAFVLFSVAEANHVLPADVGAMLVLVVTLSMMSTPLLLIVNRRFIESRFLRGGVRPFDEIQEAESPVIIAGYGRMGQMVGRLLQAAGFNTTIIERDPDQIEMLRRFGWKVYYGDAARLDLLQAAGIEQARLLVIAIDDEDTLLRLVDLVKDRYPDLPIVVRARNRTVGYQLLDRGVEWFERETFLSAVKMGEFALRALGVDLDEARQAAQTFRDYDIETMKALHPYHRDQEKLVTLAKQSRVDLEALIHQEQAVIRDRTDRAAESG